MVRNPWLVNLSGMNLLTCFDGNLVLVYLAFYGLRPFGS